MTAKLFVSSSAPDAELFVSLRAFERSLPFRPWHARDEELLLTPGDASERGIEIWPARAIAAEVGPGFTGNV